MAEDDSSRELYYEMARDLLSEVSKEFEEEMGRRPNSLELLEILAWTLRGVESDSIDNIHPSQLLGLNLRLAGRGRKSPKPDDAEAAREEVSSLNDPVFVVASDLLGDLLDTFRRELGRSPRIEELCGILGGGFRRFGEGTASDVSADQIADIEPIVRKGKKIAAKIGDIIAIPTSEDKYFLSCVLAKNRFGVAYGFFRGASSIRPLSLANHPPIYPFPFYSGEDEVSKGRWIIVGHGKDLLQLFSPEPEIFHSKKDEPDNDAIGPFGSGETADGKLRDLSEGEARDSGLLAGTYQQVYLEEMLEAYLPKVLLR